MRKILASGAIGGAIAIAIAMAAPASAVASGKADLSVLHGIPGLTVDVYVNGALTLDDFTPGTLVARRRTASANASPYASPTGTRQCPRSRRSGAQLPITTSPPDITHEKGPQLCVP